MNPDRRFRNRGPHPRVLVASPRLRTDGNRRVSYESRRRLPDSSWHRNTLSTINRASRKKLAPAYQVQPLSDSVTGRIVSYAVHAVTAASFAAIGSFALDFLLM